LNKNEIIRNVALIIVFCAVGFVLFTENVRTVQIIGLFACGAVAGVSLSKIIAALKTKKNPE
jgi:predicted metal-binding protein